LTLVIAGDRSGVGKTTITLALLAALRQRGLAVQSFKVGPDYIDPMFHQFVTARPCRNLDLVLTSESYLQSCLDKHCQGINSALIEGVMGLFDGAGGTVWGSTAHVARLLKLPILLVVDCTGLSGSIAAIVHGYQTFDPRLDLAGVILNRVGSDRHIAMLKSALAPLGVPVLGVFPRQEEISIPSRHLGLVPAAELPQLRSLVDRLANLAENGFDWPQLLPYLEVTPAQNPAGPQQVLPPLPKLKIAIAQDAAFNFYYPDNLDLLTQLGAKLIPWSPIQDQVLPAGVQGLYLGGGFPEMFAPALAENHSGRQAVYQAIQSGMPTYAECGGLMYLCQQLETPQKQVFPMVGILPAQVCMGPRLTLGYRRAIALQDTSLLTQGTPIWGHEFHRSQLLQPPQPPIFELSVFGETAASPPLLREGWQYRQLHASYLHLHWGDRPQLPHRFLSRCHHWQP
jgi:cobyrinic acid a,c-diamide synthase